MSRKKQEYKPPNIVYRGDHSPVFTITNGDQVIKLPADQSKPFYHPAAKVILRLFPYLYKKVISKG